MLFVEGFKRPERFLALADRALAMGKPILAVKVGRSAQAQDAAIAHSGSLAGEDRATDAALEAAGVIRCDDLDELLEQAELIAGTGRLGPRGGSRADGRRDGLDRGGVAGRRPRAAHRASTCRRCRTAPARRSSRACRRWATSATRWIRGAPTTRSRAYRVAFEALAASGRVRRAGDRPRLAVPRPARARSRSRRTVSTALIDATAGRPGPAPGVRLADRGRRQRAGQGDARRGRRHADAPRARSRRCRDRPARRLGGARGRSASPAGRVARAGRRSPRRTSPGGADADARPARARDGGRARPRAARVLAERESLERARRRRPAR